jgi:hypothetical protein
MFSNVKVIVRFSPMPPFFSKLCLFLHYQNFADFSDFFFYYWMVYQTCCNASCSSRYRGTLRRPDLKPRCFHCIDFQPNDHDGEVTNQSIVLPLKKDKLGFLKAKYGLFKVVIILLLLECIDNDLNYRCFIVSALLQQLWLYILDCVVLSTSIVPFTSPCDRDKFSR